MRFRAILRKNIVILQSNQNIRSMKADLIIGRDKEKAELQRCIDSDRSELVIVYGRRRVGKTYLVDNSLVGSTTSLSLEDTISPNAPNCAVLPKH